MKRFGASAPAKVLAEKFGFTAANIVQRAHELLGWGLGTGDWGLGTGENSG